MILHKIDFHTHCFPDSLAPRALKSLGDCSGLIPETDGTADGLLKSMDSGGVDISVVLGIATNARQQKSVNDFAAKLNENERLVGFGSVYPDAPDALCELERIKALGLKGVKFHPEYQEFYADDEKMRPIYRKISELGLITVFHAGADYGFPAPYHCKPEHLKNALKMLDTNVVAAHWGGLALHEEVLDTLCGLPLYFDTSFAYGSTCLPMIRKIAEKHGADKILFGTDSPWHTPEKESRVIEFLGLDTEEKEKIFYKNAAKLLDI